MYFHTSTIVYSIYNYVFNCIVQCEAKLREANIIVGEKQKAEFPNPCVTFVIDTSKMDVVAEYHKNEIVLYNVFSYICFNRWHTLNVFLKLYVDLLCPQSLSGSFRSSSFRCFKLGSLSLKGNILSFIIVECS